MLTPPDPITQIGLAIPLLILYELSIFSVKFIENKNLKDLMHNLKEIRKDFDAFKKVIEKRSVDIDFNKLKDLDKKIENYPKKRNFRKRKKRYFKI